VDNVTTDAEHVWDNVAAFMDEWRACRDYPIGA
jgi:hypothetical protein